jgi:hypothetical protein
VIATWCFIVVGVIRELSAAVILFTSETKVISVLIFDLNESGDLGAIAVLGLIMLIVTFTVVFFVNRFPVFVFSAMILLALIVLNPRLGGPLAALLAAFGIAKIYQRRSRLKLDTTLGLGSLPPPGQ